jgi:hypothetical protein
MSTEEAALILDRFQKLLAELPQASPERQSEIRVELDDLTGEVHLLSRRQPQN